MHANTALHREFNVDTEGLANSENQGNLLKEYLTLTILTVEKSWALAYREFTVFMWPFP